MDAIGAARARIVFTDAEMDWYAAKVREGLVHSDILLRLDATLISIEQQDQASRLARLAFIESRAKETRELLTARGTVLTIEPRIRRHWTDALDEAVRDELRRSEAISEQVRSGTFPLRDVLDVMVEMVRFLPVSLGDIRELSDDVVQYAARHQLCLPLLTKVLPMLKVAFVEPRNLQAFVVEDEDTDDDWLDIELDVSEDTRPQGEDPAQRFLAFIRVLYSAVPSSTANRMRFSYRVR